MIEIKPSIAVITHNAAHGGSVGTVAWNQIIQLSRQFTVYVITEDAPDCELDNIRPLILNAKKWGVLRRFCHVPNELSFLKAARQALDVLCAEVNLKAVWCHSHGAMSLVASPVARKKKFLKIMTTHGDIYDRPKGTYDFFLTQFYKLVTKGAYSQSDVVQALSPYMGDLAIRHGARTPSVKIVPNGVNSLEIGLDQVIQRTPDYFQESDFLRVLFVGNIQAIKGVKYLIAAIKEAQDSGCSTIRLTCVGDGPERPQLQNLVNAFGLENRINFVGKVPRKRLGAFYQNADLLCVPSITDSLPTVVMEAFTAGLPVVGSSAGGIPHMVTRERGWTFETGNEAQLADLLQMLARDKTKLIEVSSACSHAAEAVFNWHKIGSKLIGIVNGD